MSYSCCKESLYNCGIAVVVTKGRGFYYVQTHPFSQV